MKPKTIIIGLGVCGLVLLTITALLKWLIIPLVVRNKIADRLSLKNGTEAWERWMEPPVPVQFRVYVFEVTNPGGVLKGEKPKVTEKGPYVYAEKREKTIISITNETIIYEQKSIMTFDKIASNGLSDEEILTVVNIPAVTLSQVVDGLNHMNSAITFYDTAIHKMWNTTDKNPIFIKAKVKDYIFGGLEMNCRHVNFFHNIDLRILCNSFKIVHPRAVVMDDGEKGVHKFSVFGFKNNVTDGIYEIYSGVDDITKLGQVKTWNSETEVHHWKGKTCNEIIGSDGSIYRPYLAMDNVNSVNIYQTDACRSIKLTYENDVEYKGVTGRRYIGDKNLFGCVTDNPDNHCYCPQSVKGITGYNGCLRSGVVEITSCQAAPIILSYPHFYLADEIYQNGVEGLKADEAKHKLLMDLEPYTGYPLRIANRIQVNVFLKSIPQVTVLKNLPNVLIPTVWIEEFMELTDDLIEELDSQILNLLNIVYIVLWILFAVAISMIAGAIIYYFVNDKRKKTEES